MKIVSNTSPIINLALIGQLDLLREIFDQIIIPPAVFQEIVEHGQGRAGAREVAEYAWFTVEPVQEDYLIQTLRQDLHLGEAEAVALAITQSADWLLIDERRARQVADNLGVRYTGVLRILEIAKHQGLLPAVKPLLDDLKQVAGFWMSAALYHHILARVGE